MEGAISRQQRDHVEAASRHFYLAVDRQEFKMRTFFDLLEHFWRQSGVPLVICCNTRDGLDAVFAAASSRPQFSTKFLHSDLGEHERMATIEEFHQATAEWKKEVTAEKLLLLVATDVCLPSNTFGEHSLSAKAVINYDLPTKKEAYVRRLAACMNPSKAESGIVINIVVGGEVATLRGIEEGFGVISEIPLDIIELL